LYKLAIFDFDGTLADSASGIVDVMKEVVAEYSLSDQLLNQWSHLIGVPLLRQMEILFPDKGAAFHEEVANRYRDIYDHKVIEICPLFPDLTHMLDRLSDERVLVTIATSKRKHLVEEVLHHHNLGKFFVMIVGAQEVENHKPHPESVHLTIDNLNVPKHETVVIGDSSFDLDMARNAGVDAIGVTTGIHTREMLQKSSPRYIVDSLKEVLPIILNGRHS
jgi:phosphoglycolate phosphatase